MGERVRVRGFSDGKMGHGKPHAACPLTLSLSPKSLLSIRFFLAGLVDGNDSGERGPSYMNGLACEIVTIAKERMW